MSVNTECINASDTEQYRTPSGPQRKQSEHLACVFQRHVDPTAFTDDMPLCRDHDSTQIGSPMLLYTPKCLYPEKAI